MLAARQHLYLSVEARHSFSSSWKYHLDDVRSYVNNTLRAWSRFVPGLIDKIIGQINTLKTSGGNEYSDEDLIAQQLAVQVAQVRHPQRAEIRVVEDELEGGIRPLGPQQQTQSSGCRKKARVMCPTRRGRRSSRQHCSSGGCNW